MEEALGMKEQEVKTKMPMHLKALTFDLWVTALALAFLETKKSDQKEIWELVAQKGKKCLEKNLGPQEADNIMKAGVTAIK